MEENKVTRMRRLDELRASELQRLGVGGGTISDATIKAGLNGHDHRDNRDPGVLGTTVLAMTAEYGLTLAQAVKLHEGSKRAVPRP